MDAGSSMVIAEGSLKLSVVLWQVIALAEKQRIALDDVENDLIEET